ncbi:peptidoglycan DD-metalloendopeptidase family protein [Lysobacter sp. H23M47]|uniref:M23 family metallopeptidase n=1 Tax=Lysobacter sp. H23M47 TaxID=2781024 RepID=UPI00188206D1|nr:peptidoglycan DD-metalloendopeptidase family protein [Lysobacter sp. H23M47]QOW24704.1 peptidoglycan DD-metalloendopeptidase family protein [Lysobacter sp. H23M47]
MTPTDPGTIRRNRLKRLRKTALQRPVVARRLSDGFSGRWSRRQWVQASLFVTIGALVAAIVPGFGDLQAGSTPLARQSMALPLPPIAMQPAQPRPEHDWQVVRVQSGQTLGAVFQQMGIPAATMHRILEQPGAKPALTRLGTGAELAFDMADGSLRRFRYDRDPAHRVELSLKGDTITEQVIERPTELRSIVSSGEIQSSLYVAARKAGLPANAIATMTDEIFNYDIDFTSAKKGDRFSVVYDQVWREGELVGSGDIRAATFTTGGKTFSGFRFEHDGKVGYYTAEGRPLKKSFIRMPIPYARVTSGFTTARKHPILGKTRAHQGVDYGAGSGTPIMAAGDARVQFVGWKGGYGRTVVLDHGRGYTTLYAHMSRFGKFKVGQRVPQGSVIGYVGSTGLATGPHLHYEFRVNGVHRNPLNVTMPPAEPLKGAALVAFRAETAPALARIQEVEGLLRNNAMVASKAPAKVDTTTGVDQQA